MVSKGFLQLPHDAFTSGLVAEMGPTAFAVWCVLLRHANGSGTRCYPSHATIAKQAGISVRSSMRAVEKLESLELIEVQRRQDDATKTRNVYLMLDSATVSPLIVTESHHDSATVSPSMVTNCHPDSDKNDTQIVTKTTPKEEPRRRTKKKSAFAPPSVQEVRQEVTTRNLSIDAENFVAYYESQGWKKSNGQMVKDWQACLTTWAKRERNAPSPVSLRARPSKPLLNAATMRRGARND